MTDSAAPEGRGGGQPPTDNPFSQWDHWVDQIPTPLLVKDLEGRYQACNRAFEELTGIPRKRLVGGTVYDLEETSEAALHSEMDCRLLATGEPQCYEAIIRSAHQGVIHAQLDKALLRDAEGNPVGIVGVITDLRAQRKMARELRLREAAIASAHSPIAIIALDGTLLYVNEAFVVAAQTESATRLLGTHVGDLGLGREKANQIIAVVQARGHWEGELQLPDPEGHIRVWRVNAHLVPEEEGQPRCLMADFEDVTQARATEEKLRRREARYRELVESVNSIILRLDSEGRITFLNEFAERFFGYSEEELLWRNVVGTIVPLVDSQGHDLQEKINDLLRHPERYSSSENENITRDGRRVWISWTNRPVLDEEGQLTGLLCVGNDLTARRQMELQLRIHQAAVESSSNGIGLASLEGIITYVNRAYLDLWSYDRPEEVVGRHISEFMPPTETAEIGRAIEMQGRWQGERVAIRRDGTRFQIQVAANVVSDTDGKPICLMASFADISARVVAEEELRKFRTISDNANYGATIIDMEGHILYVNDAFARMHGYEPEELIGQTIFILHDTDQQSRIRELGDQLRAEGVIGAAELIRRRKDGSTFPSLMNVHLVQDEEGQPLFRAATVIDITEQQRLQQEAFRAQKLESLGVLAGGIAHDFNNLLTAVLGHLALAQVRLSPTDLPAEELAAAEKAALLAKHLTGQLLTFARGGDPVKKVLSLPGLLADAMALATSGARVHATLEAPDDLWAVEADEGQLVQVVNNLVLNAVQASANGKPVQVSARNRILNPGDSNKLEPGPYVQITVQDQGKGISPADLSQIYDPYFTTKPEGHGLGLTIAYAIVAKHQGMIEVTSAPEQGTLFTVLIPSTGALPPPSGPALEPGPPGSGRVLVMDDDALVRKVALAILRHLGYEPVAVTQGEEAVAAYRQALQEGQPFSVVLLDLTIRGGQGGLQTLHELQALDPQVRALACSGYSTDPVMSDWERHGFAGVVTKPYRMAELGEALRAGR
jgi:PAS domain S-box-containing protein